MEARTAEKGKTLIVTIEGDILGVETVVLCRRLEALAEERFDRVVVDLSNVKAIDSYAVGGFTYTDILFKKKNVTLVLVMAPQSTVKAMFRSCNLDRVLTIVDSVEAAG